MEIFEVNLVNLFCATGIIYPLIISIFYIRGFLVFLPFHDGGRYHIETSPLICGANHGLVSI